MTGIIIALLISWILLWFWDKKKLSVLGLRPSKSSVIAFVAGFLLAGVACSIYHIMTAVSAGNQWTLRPGFTLPAALAGSWWTLKSVLYEEFIFRGALLYIAIEKLGVKIACLLSAACFGIYHWFSYNAFGSPVQMIIVFLFTGFFGYSLAVAFARTKSLYLPVGVHFGWNLLNIVVFSNGPLGPQLFAKMNTNKPEGILSLFLFLFQAFTIPLLTLWYANRRTISR